MLAILQNIRKLFGPVCMLCTMRGFRNFSGNVHNGLNFRTIENNKHIQRPEARSASSGRCFFLPATTVGNLPWGTDDSLGEHARAGATGDEPGASPCVLGCLRKLLLLLLLLPGLALLSLRISMYCSFAIICLEQRGHKGICQGNRSEPNVPDVITTTLH